MPLLKWPLIVSHNKGLWVSVRSEDVCSDDRDIDECMLLELTSPPDLFKRKTFKSLWYVIQYLFRLKTILIQTPLAYPSEYVLKSFFSHWWIFKKKLMTGTRKYLDGFILRVASPKFTQIRDTVILTINALWLRFLAGRRLSSITYKLSK